MVGSRDAPDPAGIHAGGLLRSSEPSGARSETTPVLWQLRGVERPIQVPMRRWLFLLVPAGERSTSFGSDGADDPASG